MFNKFTNKSQEVIINAQIIAQDNGQQQIESLHILASLLAQDESLIKPVLEKMKILNTKVKKTTPKDKTPWIKQWTFITVEVGADKAAKVAEELSRCLEGSHNWYADFKNDDLHFIVFRNKVFRITRTEEKQYAEAKKYGLKLGIPEYQVNFHPENKK